MYPNLPMVVLTHAHCNVIGFFVQDKVGSGNWWVVVQKETWTQHVQVKVVDLMIRTNIDGVFMDMQAIGGTRDIARDVERKEGMLAIEMERVDAIVNIEASKNDGEPFVELD